MKTLSLALVGLMHATLAQAEYEIGLPAQLDRALKDCQAELRLLEEIACPTVQMYALPRISQRHIDKIEDSGVIADLYQSGERASAASAQNMLIDSVESQITGAEENDSAATPRQEQALRNALKQIRTTLEKASARGHEIRTHADTYWAPSVNARGVLIIDRKRSVLTVILHGDTDG